MKPNRTLILAAILSGFMAVTAWAETRVYFSPPLPGDKKVADFIVEAIQGSSTQILIQQYQLTEPKIIKALADASRRGIVEIAIFDKTVTNSKQGRQGVKDLEAAGADVWFDPVHIAHNKVLIIDRKMVIGGSFNLTANANAHNCENCTFIDDPPIVQRFLENFKRRLEKAQATE
ncbi:MAG: phospholipase D-like domain-containing protein [Syntrophobacterales bacterium]|nr:phospholipase D-like domain-containing protein [Syntrophobacterales bacterium]